MYKKPQMYRFLGAALTLLTLLIMPSQSFSYEQELSRIAGKLAMVIDKAGKQNVATVDFSDLQGNVTELGRFIAEELSTSLVMSEKSFTIVDRTHLGRILAEQKLSITGLLDPKNAKKLGQIAGVDALIIGNITPLGENVRLSIKVVATDTANVIAAARGSIAMTGAIRDMSERSIDTGFASGLPSGLPVGGGSSAPQIQPDRSKTAFQNKFLKVSLKTARRIGDDGKMITFSLWIENTTKDDMYLSLNDNTSAVFLLDEFGSQWFRAKPAVGITTDKRSHTYCKKVKKLLLPGQAIPVSIVFQSTEASRGKQFTFNAGFIGCVKGISKTAKFSVVLDGIRVP